MLDHVYSARHLTFTRPKPNVPKHEAWKEFYIFEWQTPLGGLFCIAVAFVMFMLTLRCGAECCEPDARTHARTGNPSFVYITTLHIGVED